jgi:hypothetical protein
LTLNGTKNARLCATNRTTQLNQCGGGGVIVRVRCEHVGESLSFCELSSTDRHKEADGERVFAFLKMFRGAIAHVFTLYLRRAVMPNWHNERTKQARTH